jgi:hypothetical protein
VFTGEYRHSVDDKGRLAVPSRFRAQLDAGLVVSRWLENCLAIHTGPAGTLADKVATLPIADERARRFEQFIFAGAVETTLDGRAASSSPAFSGTWPASQAGRRSRHARPRRDLGSRRQVVPPGLEIGALTRPSGLGTSNGPAAEAADDPRPGSLGIRRSNGGGLMQEGHLPVLVEEVM